MEVIMPSTQKAEGDFSKDVSLPKYTDIILPKDELIQFPLYCVFCKRTMAGKIVTENSITYNYSCDHCKRNYRVSFKTKGEGISA
jgi:transposase-like protein